MGYAHSTVTSARQQSPKARSVLSCSVRLCFLFMTRQTWAPSVPELPLLEETPRRCVLRASIRFRPRPQRRTQAWPPKRKRSHHRLLLSVHSGPGSVGIGIGISITSNVSSSHTS